MFITAADIGKFLSEMVTRFYIKFLEFYRYVIRKFFPRYAAKSPPATTSKASSANTDDILFGLDDGDHEERVELPIFAYFSLILGYCAIGGLLFNSFENGPVWSFIHGFFFSFNTITTIGLGNIMVRNMMYLVLIVIYCIVGLAVITMCVDLASAQLKMLFTKLHYFGRKIRGARSTFFMAMSDDIKEAIRLIAALKKSRFSKDNITLEDIKKFLEIELHGKSQPFVPSNIHFIQWVDDEELGSDRSGGNFMLSANLLAPSSSSPPSIKLVPPPPPPPPPSTAPQHSSSNGPSSFTATNLNETVNVHI